MLFREAGEEERSEELEERWEMEVGGGGGRRSCGGCVVVIDG